MKTTKRILCILLAMLTMLAFLSATAAAAGPEPGKAPFKVLFSLPNRGNPNAPVCRFFSLVAIPITIPSTNYRLQVNRVEVNEDNALEVFIEIVDTGTVGAMVVLDYWAVLYVPLKAVKGANGVVVTLDT